jgi:hypothetical protein
VRSSEHEEGVTFEWVSKQGEEENWKDERMAAIWGCVLNVVQEDAFVGYLELKYVGKAWTRCPTFHFI